MKRTLIYMFAWVISSLLLRCSRRKKNGNPGMSTWIFVLFVSMNYSNLL